MTLSIPMDQDQHERVDSAYSGSPSSFKVYSMLNWKEKEAEYNQTFLNKYTIVHLLGQGATSSVYLVQRKSDLQLFCVKIVKKSLIPTDCWKRDKELGVIPLEFYILKRMKHAHIIQFCELMEDDYYMYLVMENTTSQLHSHATQDLSFKVSSLLYHQVKHVFKQIVSAVYYLHQHNVCHLDIKDENVVLDEYFNVKLIDFGSAQLSTRYCKEYRGSNRFSSPEVLLGMFKFDGKAVDMYALGVLLYLMVYGTYPDSNGTLVIQQDREDSLIDLLKGLLDVNPLSRLTSEQVLKHFWLSFK